MSSQSGGLNPLTLERHFQKFVIILIEIYYEFWKVSSSYLIFDMIGENREQERIDEKNFERLGYHRSCWSNRSHSVCRLLGDLATNQPLVETGESWVKLAVEIRAVAVSLSTATTVGQQVKVIPFSFFVALGVRS